MPRLHIIVGDANTRKSSLLRCLTGVSGGRNANQLMDVLFVSGQIVRVFCTTSALQEALNPKDAQEFIDDIKSMNPIPADVAITLRVSPRSRYPAAVAYLQAFARARWQVVNVALLGSSAAALSQFAPATNVVRIPNSVVQPTNQTAAAVRHSWGWV